MILEKPQFESMIARVNALKKTKVEEKEIRRIMTGVFNAIDQFNVLLSEYNKRFWDYDLSEIPVLNEFKDFVLPASVKVNAADVQCKDLIDREQTYLTYPMEKKQNLLDVIQVINSLSSYLDLLAEFRGIFRSDSTSNITYLSELKKNVSLSEISSKCAYLMEGIDGNDHWFCHYSFDTPFISVPLRSNYWQCFKDYYWNADVNDVLNVYIEKWLI